MADSQPLNLTFGVEIEFILAYFQTPEWEARFEFGKVQEMPDYHFVLAEYSEKVQMRSEIISSLRKAGFGVNDEGAANSTLWSVEGDGSVGPTLAEMESRALIFANGRQRSLSDEERKKLRFCDVEVKSCVLPFNRDSLNAVARGVRTVVENHAVYVNQTCGLHVHVGNQTLGFPVQTVKNFATLVTCFEKQFNQFHPLHRLQSQYCILETTAFHPSERDPRRMAQIIDRFQTIEDVINRFGRERNEPDVYENHWAYNLNNLLFRPDRRTIEFRQHAGTLDSAAIDRWIKLACTSITISHSIPKQALWGLIAEAATADWDIFVLLEKLHQSTLAGLFRSHCTMHPADLELPDAFL